MHERKIRTTPERVVAADPYGEGVDEGEKRYSSLRPVS
jgi:hypothetical protein